jgi:macrodomain Ter protein organizer (MatP/YcbG family)
MAAITSEEFDKKFDDGEDVLQYLDKSSVKVYHGKTKKINVDCPHWMVEALDLEADRLGITRQALIKIMLDEELKRREAIYK